MIYLDSAATSLWHPKEAEERMIQALRGCGNAGRGAHDATLDAGRIVFETRMRLAELFHAESPERIAFTCNDTEALNTAIFGLFGPGDHVGGCTDFPAGGAAGLLGEPGPAKGQAAGRRHLDGGGAAGAAWDMGGVSAVYLPATGAGDIYRPGDGDKGDRIRGTFYKVQRFMGRANQPPFFLDRGDGIRYNRGENHPGGRRRYEKNDRA